MRKIKKIFSFLGPGFITGASDDDPSGIATYSQTGAIFGFAQAWTALFSFPLMAAVQEMCGRIGLVTGKGLAGVIRDNYPKKVLYFSVFLLLFANIVNIGADLGAMAASANLVFGIPFIIALLLVVAISLALEVFVSYKTYSKYLKYLTFALLSYVLTSFVVKVDWGKVSSYTFVPHLEFSEKYILNLVAILGTTISPYLFFWQADEEVEEEVSHHKLRRMGAGLPHVTPKDISRLRIDTIVGMFFSNIIMWFIIVTTGATLFANGINNIETAEEAALALKPLAGDFAFLLFALGIIGTGLLALPILAGSASYAVSEAFGWKEGLFQKLKKAQGFYGVIIIATLLGLLINFIGINPISALYYTAVLNGIIASPLIAIIIFISNNKKIMGDRTNNFGLNVLGIFTLLMMSVASLILFSTFIF
ncbi:MAG: iron transporter [Candidatus Levybacteria bacterium RIFCSPHIGHO2_01_FULL_41_15]|nr:MAG: iron transporter [Candidatus Levybacteria bacterium RIFCSPHIGHO2_01_FULL_41_15]